MRTPKRTTSRLTVADVYSFHELGLGRNPKRSSLVWVLENKEPEIIAMSARVLFLVMQGKMTGKQALGLVGEQTVSLVKSRIKSNIAPALSEARKRAKMRSGKSGNVALIHTGQLINSLRWQITGRI